MAGAIVLCKTFIPEKRSGAAAFRQRLQTFTVNRRPRPEAGNNRTDRGGLKETICCLITAFQVRPDWKLDKA